tara:strand:- start:12861 stop:13043 length:183 start_codon:yes stop_codon:yes gene_type:complete
MEKVMSLNIRLDTRVSSEVYDRFSSLAATLRRTKSNLLRTLVEDRIKWSDRTDASVVEVA